MAGKQPVSTTSAPAAIGPYSQGIKAGGWLFVSGQIPLDPATGALVSGGIREQARQALLNVQGVVEAAGGTLDDVVKTTVLLADIADFSAANEVYGGFFQSAPPARAAYQVAALPRDARIEIEAIVYLGEK